MSSRREAHRGIHQTSGEAARGLKRGVCGQTDVSQSGGDWENE